jgi:hypothetical protein
MNEDDLEIEEMLAEMLTDGVIFISCQLDTLCVNANDVFWWACADAEPIRLDELEAFYRTWKAGGYVEWLCLKRRMRPQAPYVELLQREGRWTPALEQLPTREVP